MLCWGRTGRAVISVATAYKKGGVGGGWPFQVISSELSPAGAATSQKEVR